MNECWGRRAARLVLIAGFAATIMLQFAVPSEEVFWSGDGCAKSLLTKQYARGDLHVDLRLTNQDWVRDLWESGLHPAEFSNYIYVLNGKYYSVFPYTFPLVSAPFYALFGVRGDYVIPLVSIWAMWFIVYFAMRRAHIESWMTAALMFTLVFALPITLYSAVFWEHSLGLALAMAGVVYTLRYGDSEPGTLGPLLAGAVLGSAVWFRPEVLALIAVLLPGAFVWRRRALTSRGWFLFSAAAVSVALLFFAVNVWIYGNPLGTHGMQMIEKGETVTSLHSMIARFVSLSRMAVRFATIGGFVVVLLAALLAARVFDWRSEYVYLAVVATLFFPVMVAMVPSDGDFQLGSRFELIMFTLLVLLCAYAWRAVPRHRAMRAALVVFMLATIALGTKRSAIHETGFLIEKYRDRVLPAYRFLEQREEPVFAMSRVEASLELSGLMERKNFFAAFTDEQFAKLIDALRARRIGTFIYVGFGDMEKEDDSPIHHGVAAPLRVEPLGHYGVHFYCYSVTIPPSA